ALIKGIDTTRALALPGVRHVITGDQIRALSDPFLAVLKAPIDQWSLAVDRVRYVGEAVAVVLAGDRYIAEDGAALVDIDYEALPVVVDPRAAVRKDAPLLHPETESNELSVREFVYGDPDAAFAGAHRTISL